MTAGKIIVLLASLTAIPNIAYADGSDRGNELFPLWPVVPHFLSDVPPCNLTVEVVGAIPCAVIVGVTNCRDTAMVEIAARANIPMTWRVQVSAKTDNGDFVDFYQRNETNNFVMNLASHYSGSTFMHRYNIAVYVENSTGVYHSVASSSSNPNGLISC